MPVDRARDALPGAVLVLSAGAVLALLAPAGAGPAVGVGAAVLAAACLGAGRALAAAFGVRPDAATAFLAGLALLSHLAALGDRWAGVPVSWTAGGFALLGLAALALPARGGGDGRPGVEALSLLAAAGFALAWSLGPADAPRRLAEEGVLGLWSDAFVHAGVIAEFGDPLTVGRGNAGLSDTPYGLYHLASFALPALGVRWAGVAPFEAVATLWMPLGALSLALGALALGRALAGASGGALTLAGLAALPDGGAYGLANGVLSFHWLLAAAPGGLHGLGVAGAALALLVPWCREGRGGALALSALLLAALFLTRAHLLVWLAPPSAAAALWGWRRPSPRWRAAGLAAGAALGAAGLAWASRGEWGETGWLHHLARHAEWVHLGQAPTRWDGLYPALRSALGRAGAAAVGLPLLWIGIGGALLPAVLLLGLLAWRRGRAGAEDLVLPALLAWATLLMLLAPGSAQGDETELRHRGLVAVHLLLVAWGAGWALRLRPRLDRPGALSALALLALPVTAAGAPAWTSARMDWARPYLGAPLAPGLAEAGGWLRARARPGDTLSVSGAASTEATARDADAASALMGLSGVPVWLSRPGMQAATGVARAAAAAGRAALLRRVAEAEDAGEAARLLAGAGLRFHATTGGEQPGWDPEGALAAFAAGPVRLYELGPGPAFRAATNSP